MKPIYPFCLSFILLSQCTQDTDLAFPNAPNQLVLNSILHPDSVIKVYLTRSASIADSANQFSAMEGATVLLYENDTLVDRLAFEDGSYQINYYPTAGRRYTVEVKAEGYPTVTASDVVPQAVDVTACYKPQDWYVYNTMAVQATINDRGTEENYYWLSLSIDQYERIDFDLWVECRRSNDFDECPRYDSSTVITTKSSHMVSYSTLPDEFNSIVDNTSGGVREYQDYIRIGDESIDGTTFTLELTGGGPLYRYQELMELDSNQSLSLQLVSASQTYDRYLKSSLIYYYNNEFFDEPNPFAEPVKIYSNVENGTGIFAAFNSVSIEIGDYLCQ